MEDHLDMEESICESPRVVIFRRGWGLTRNVAIASKVNGAS